MLTIKPNVVTIGASLSDMADIMIRGDASMGLGGWAYQTMIAREKGVKLVVGYAKDRRHVLLVGHLFHRRGRARIATTPMRFINFMTSPEIERPSRHGTQLGRDGREGLRTP